MKKVKLFCIPYSGGSAEIYYSWKKYLAEYVELHPVELPGRGRRICEKPYDDLDDLLNDISSAIAGELSDDDSYSIYGHSLGAILGFETYYRLIEKGCPAPCHMFFSGRKAPQNMEAKTEYYRLPDKEFLEAVYQYSGNTREAMKDPELYNLFMPILRADFKIGETYSYEEKQCKITCDITIINGKQDKSVQGSDMNEWRLCSQGDCNIETVLGGHFFILDNRTYVTDIINNKLNNNQYLKYSSENVINQRRI